VAAAEVGSLDNTSVAELGFATVNGQMNKVESPWIGLLTLSKIITT